MGTSLSYRSVEPVGDVVRRDILAEAKRLNAERDWWCESLIFYVNDDFAGHLVGDTKLLVLFYTNDEGDPVEVDPEDDTFMMGLDASYIVDALTGWSQRFGIDWQLELAGKPLGYIRQGTPDNDLNGFLQAIAAEDGERAQDIRKRYAGR